MIIHPPQFPALVNLSAPVIFLAGPIQGATNWQATASKLVDGPDWVVANPRRAEAFSEASDAFAEQVNWETYWLKRASSCVILFWLAKEETNHPGRAYAQTTRFELGEWIAKAPESIVLGIEDGFSGEKYLRHRLMEMRGRHYNIEIFSNLNDTCMAARAMVESC